MDSFVNSNDCNNFDNCIELTAASNIESDYTNNLSTSNILFEQHQSQPNNNNNNNSSLQQASFPATTTTLTSMTNTTNVSAPPVISLLKLQNFLYQPKFKNIINTGRNSEPQGSCN